MKSLDQHAGHTHDHGHSADERALRRAMLLTAAFMFVEVAGGFYADSLALLADAGHMLTDAAALGLAWAAVRLSTRAPDSRRTFGYQRLQVLAGFVNGIALLAIVIWILIEAVGRLRAPIEVDAPVVLTIAIAGALVNVIVYRILRAANRDNLNVAGAMLHVLGDLLGSIAAGIAAIVILLTGWMPIDALLSMLVCALIFRSAFALVRHSAHILLEGAPDWLDQGELRRLLKERIPAILDVHHVHCWSLSSHETLATLHVRVPAGADHADVLLRTHGALADCYGITHATVQIETETCPDRDCSDVADPAGTADA
jgi:cobalt-zinc-cadmium efflux system protein